MIKKTESVHMSEKGSHAENRSQIHQEEAHSSMHISANRNHRSRVPEVLQSKLREKMSESRSNRPEE